MERVICDNPTGTIIPPVEGWDGRLWSCTCLVCSRCGHHGQGTQGHYWSFCKVSRQLESPHLCCPGDCELTNHA